MSNILPLVVSVAVPLGIVLLMAMILWSDYHDKEYYDENIYHRYTDKD